MFSTLLVPLDGSDLAARALPYAVFLSRALHGNLILIHAASDRALDQDAETVLETTLEQDRLAEQLVRDGVPTIAYAIAGDPGASILKAVADLHADLIVMSTHGRSGVDRLVHSSVAEYVLQHSTVPALMVTAASDRVWDHERPMRLLVPLDGSALAEEALHPALGLAQSLPIELWLARAQEERSEMNAFGFAQRVPVPAEDLESARQYLEEVAAPLRTSGLRVTVAVQAGPPADTIGDLAEREAIDLVAMVTRGQGGLGRFLLERMASVASAGQVPLHLGSVAASVLRRLNVPMLLVRPSSSIDESHMPGVPHATPEGEPG
jgi:nucleotide-binding universal stress UspA family protein